MPDFLIPIIIIFSILILAGFIYSGYCMVNTIKDIKKTHIFQYEELTVEVSLSLKKAQLKINDIIRDEIVGFNVTSFHLNAEVEGYKVKVNIAKYFGGKFKFVLFINDEKITDYF